MQDVLVDFINGVKDKKHLMELVSDSLILSIKTEKGNANLFIGNGDLTLLDSEEILPDVEIKGEENVISSILQGKLKLREAVKREHLEIEATYRSTLFLETLFILGKPY
ncbi:SCP2 sterol-binding domain-containing protein [Bacillus massilinigeriensis]|uniref:SCP2 sterol-binding domain-containing protein n=1 Tax=Bacillus massilionigeriensis TaxID=1805475 RepID=UPI00096B26C4|nr:SCP2 sterol-binding domain-containing protein [Bacillus massilionigeriensis]